MESKEDAKFDMSIEKASPSEREPPHLPKIVFFKAHQISTSISGIAIGEVNDVSYFPTDPQSLQSLA